jgi:Uma2 family endonuclease
MGLSQPTTPFSGAEYLAWESEQSRKHEFFHGGIFAMVGASRHHVTVAVNLLSALDRALSPRRQ